MLYSLVYNCQEIDWQWEVSISKYFYKGRVVLKQPMDSQCLIIQWGVDKNSGNMFRNLF